MAAKKNLYIHVGDNDAPEIQCIVCKQDNCDYYIELDFTNIQFIGIHDYCFTGYAEIKKGYSSAKRKSK